MVRSTARSKVVTVAICAFFTIFVLVWIQPLYLSFPHPSLISFSGAAGRARRVLEKPAGFPVIGLVFYGRKETVSILDCYLKRNLAENGGFLDQVIFVVRTEIAQDLEYLEELLATTSSYVKVDLNEGRSGNYSKPWETLEAGPMYIKIDDDVVFMEDQVIPNIVNSLANHPEFFLVSANLINQPAFSWVHYHLGVVHAYLPELDPPADLDQRKAGWRASELPEWSGPQDRDFKADFVAPFKGHRWLPPKKGTLDDDTPIATTEYHQASRGWSSWAVAAQQHYSFFENLENDDLDAYHFGMWDFKYERISVHLLAIWGKDIIDNIPFDADDEGYLTVTLPRKHKRHAIMDGKGVASHFSFGAQQGVNMGEGNHGMEWTDVLDRYRAYAEERVCGRLP